MQVDLGNLAQALNEREGKVRIILGIPTALQKLIRGAQSFPAIAALANHFPSEDRDLRSCGPKFEKEEQAEYETRRAELFESYLAEFNTLEEMKSFRVITADPLELIGITSTERELASAKVAKLLQDELTAAGENLQSILIIREKAEHFGKKRGLRDRRLDEAINHSLQQAFIKALKEAPEITSRITIIKAMPMSSYELFGSSRDYRGEKISPRWRFILEDVRSLEEGFLLEKDSEDNYLDREAVKARLAELLDARMAELDTFTERQVEADKLSDRDNNGSDFLYGRALELAAEKATGRGDVGLLIGLWENRKKRTPPGCRELNFSPIIASKWDKFVLPQVETTTNIQMLAAYLRKSPSASQSWHTAYRKLGEHFAAKVAIAQSEEELESIREEAESLSQRICVYTYDRSDELRKARKAHEAEARLARIVSGEEQEPKDTLLDLYHYYADKDAEKTRQVVRLLAPYFPAETIVEIGV